MKQIQNFNDYYVDNNGNVYSKKQGSLKRLKKRIDRNGYVSYILRKSKNEPINVLAHRLVAIHYLEKIEGKDFVNHINLNKQDNNYLNLEWVTKSENSIHYFKIKNPINSNSKVKISLLNEIRKDLINNNYYGGIKKVSEKYNLPYKIILNINNNKYYKNK
jgi:hypothetical protein